MKTLISSRLEELQSEYKKGQERLTMLEQETNNIRNSMLRISGAIQVLEELLKQEEPMIQPHSNGTNHVQTTEQVKNQNE